MSSILHGGPDNPSALSVLTRIYWMMGWPFLLITLSKFVFDSNVSHLLSAFFYLFLWLSMVSAKYLDVFKFKGTTAGGLQATPSHFYQYLICSFLLILAIFIAITVYKI